MATKKTTTKKSTAAAKKPAAPKKATATKKPVAKKPATPKKTTAAKKPAAAQKPAVPKKGRYIVTVAKRNREYGNGSFSVGCVNTITEAREVVRRNSRNGDLYKISKAGTDTYKKENQVEVGTVHGTGKAKVLQGGYNYRTGQF